MTNKMCLTRPRTTHTRKKTAKVAAALQDAKLLKPHHDKKALELQHSGATTTASMHWLPHLAKWAHIFRCKHGGMFLGNFGAVCVSLHNLSCLQPAYNPLQLTTEAFQGDQTRGKSSYGDDQASPS